MNKHSLEIRNARPEEFEEIGRLMVRVYGELDGFPNQQEQPEYYKMLLEVGKLSEKEHTALVVAVSNARKVVGAVVYFSDLKNYGSGGTVTRIKNASGFRLLSVDPGTRGKGIGKLLTKECIERAKKEGRTALYIHSTASMKIAWKMYENMGFKRFEEIDFMQGELPVFGFRFSL